jgi:hypothetical protein
MTEEETSGRRRLHNEELHNLHSSPMLYEDPDKLVETFRACSTHGSGKGNMQNYVRKTLRQ